MCVFFHSYLFIVCRSAFFLFSFYLWWCVMHNRQVFTHRKMWVGLNCLIIRKPQIKKERKKRNNVASYTLECIAVQTFKTVWIDYITIGLNILLIKTTRRILVITSYMLISSFCRSNGWKNLFKPIIFDNQNPNTKKQKSHMMIMILNTNVNNHLIL